MTRIDIYLHLCKGFVEESLATLLLFVILWDYHHKVSLGGNRTTVVYVFFMTDREVVYGYGDIKETYGWNNKIGHF